MVEEFLPNSFTLFILDRAKFIKNMSDNLTRIPIEKSADFVIGTVAIR